MNFFFSKDIDQMMEDSCPQIITAIRSIVSFESISADIKDQVIAMILVQ